MTSKPIDSTVAADSGLPDFAQPPVDETVLSIQFAPIQGFGVPHFGLFWSRVRDDYPKFEVQPPIPNVTERFPGAPVARQFGLQLIDVPEVRCWFLDKSGNGVIQIQQDRFVLNWRKITGAEKYPRYPALRMALEKEWARFCAFLKDEGLERPKVNQCEVSYVNNIEYEKGWSGYGELHKVVATIATPSRKGKFLPVPERINMQVLYRLGDDAGRLYVGFVPVIRVLDGKEVLQMTLTARGAPKSSSDEDVFGWLDLGRRWVVRGFEDFTTKEMHELWGQQ